MRDTGISVKHTQIYVIVPHVSGLEEKQYQILLAMNINGPSLSIQESSQRKKGTIERGHSLVLSKCLLRVDITPPLTSLGITLNNYRLMNLKKLAWTIIQLPSSLRSV